MAINQIQPVQPSRYFTDLTPQFDALSEVALRNRAEQEKLRQTEEMRGQLSGLFKNPTQENFARFGMMYPGMREMVGDAAKMISAEQRDKEFGFGVQVSNALEAGRPDVAKSLLSTTIEAYKQSGKDHGIYQQVFDMLAADNVSGAQAATNFALAAIDGEKLRKVVEARKGAGTLTADIAKEGFAAKEAEYKAYKAGVDAKYAESKAQWDIEKVKNDIASDKERNRIAAMNAAISRETNDIKRQELRLKVTELQDKITGDARQKVADLEAGRATIDNFLNTSDRLLQNPSLNRVLGAVEGRLPGGSAPLSDEAANAIALIDTISSQSFMSQVSSMKGLGALSNAEGQKLESALTNLSRAQGEKQFTDNVKEAQRIMLKARSNLATRYGAKNTVPDTPAAKPQGGKSVDDMLRELGVVK